jgi:hypothetical protein
MRQAIVVLEDNAERIAAMDDCLADKFPFFQRRFFRTAPGAISWLADRAWAVERVMPDDDIR